MVRCLVLAFATALCVAGIATAAPVSVDLRVEGSEATPFEQSISTDVKQVVQAGQSRKCDGTNGGAYPSPGPTMISALDDAAALGGFDWVGTWHDSFEDFFIDRIGPDENEGTANWGLVLNWQSTERGGCQTQVNSGDEVLFAYDIFTKVHLLKLVAPRMAQVGEQFQVEVTDGASGDAIPGASVEGELTGADGRATLSYPTPGVKSPKAERFDSVRSNAASICVYVPGTEPCGAPAPPADTGPLEQEPPVTSVGYPRAGARYRRGPRVIRGTVDESGSGVDYTELALLRRRDGRCATWSDIEARFAGGKCRRPDWFRVGASRRWSYRFPGRLGEARYVIRARSIDKAGNEEVARQVRFVVRS